MEARAKLFGHPIHQMLIVLPLGLLTGVVTGLLAAVFGLIDWTKIPGGTRAKRVGLLHAAANVVGVGVDPGAHLDAPSSLSGRPASDRA